MPFFLIHVANRASDSPVVIPRASVADTGSFDDAGTIKANASKWSKGCPHAMIPSSCGVVCVFAAYLHDNCTPFGSSFAWRKVAAVPFTLWLLVQVESGLYQEIFWFCLHVYKVQREHSTVPGRTKGSSDDEIEMRRLKRGCEHRIFTRSCPANICTNEVSGP